MPDIRFEARLEHILSAAVAGLSEEDRAARIQWCRESGQHGVTMHPEPAGARFEWGGQTLAVVDRELFADDAYLRDVQITMLPQAPEDPRDLA